MLYHHIIITNIRIQYFHKIFYNHRHYHWHLVTKSDKYIYILKGHKIPLQLL